MENDQVMMYQKMVSPSNFYTKLNRERSDLFKTEIPSDTVYKLRNLFAQDFCIVLLITGNKKESVKERGEEFLVELSNFLNLSGKTILYDEDQYFHSLKDYLISFDKKITPLIYSMELRFLRDSYTCSIMSSEKNFFGLQDNADSFTAEEEKVPVIGVQSSFVEYESGAFECRIVVANNKKIIELEEFRNKLVKEAVDERNKIIKQKLKITKLNKREPIGPKLRHEVFKRDNYKCIDCGFTKEQGVLHVDHILPVSQGGTDELSNLQTLCYKCNLAKSNRAWGKSTIPDAV